MRFWEKVLFKSLKRKLEGKLVREVLRRHWPAVEKTIREEFSGQNLKLALKAARRGCERLLEHMV